ncbi:MAG: 4Fe-4S binding protein [ANME-2 cluster archaeon]|nr:4Fe-4S binding protein [ANME-2 cluster archaeon]MDF1556875.1 4Fe-4S binding protein [ANME-2 cluster archaeon]
MAVIINENACDRAPHCGMIRLCPTGAISQSAGGYPSVDPDSCIECGQCVDVCPHQAISIV